MCGIIGVIDNSVELINREAFTLLQDTMQKRGPDGGGQFFENSIAMGMRRLAIIDLPGGNQPFFSANGSIVAFQNGEIYNFKELKKTLTADGYIFISNSDTEVLAHGYAAWGIDELLSRIDGMFALSILDRKRRELHLARDRFGEKPLFYTQSKKQFAYASSVLPLAALPWVKEDIDPISLSRYLALHYIPGDKTIFSSIHRILPGQRLTLSIDDLSHETYQYYHPKLRKTTNLGDEELCNLLEFSVESRMLADVPVGVFLSGGLDSSVVAAIGAKKNPKLSTFSIGFCGSSRDESVFSKTVAQHIGSKHFHFNFDGGSFRELLPKVNRNLDEPLGDQALLPLYWLSEQAKKHVDVVLSGEAADEVFAGYQYYEPWSREYRRSFLSLFRKKSKKPTSLFDESTVKSLSGFPLIIRQAVRRKLLANVNSIDTWEEQLVNWLNTSSNSLQRATATDLTTWLPNDLLVKLDSMTMAHSLEARAPYLYPELVEAGLNLPLFERYKNKDSKIMLRRVASRWLPEEILRREKQGFLLPMSQWLDDWIKSFGNAANYIKNRNTLGLNEKALTKMLEKKIKNERFIFSMIMLLEWHDAFFDRLALLKKHLHNI